MAGFLALHRGPGEEEGLSWGWGIEVAGRGRRMALPVRASPCALPSQQDLAPGEQTAALGTAICRHAALTSVPQPWCL